MTEPGYPTAEQLNARGEAQELLQEQARAAARARFGRKVFVRGVVEISNYCRENCAYCGMRRDNRKLHRSRANWQELATMLVEQRPASMTDINLQAGEDVVAVREVALPLIRSLRQNTNLGISVCLGMLSPALYSELLDAGAKIYIMKFEMAQAEAYQRLEAPGTLADRLSHIRHLAERGWHVSSGFIAGLPEQTAEECVENCRLAATLPLRGCSVSPFIPGEETPLGKLPMADINVTLNCMVALRLLRPDWVIPSVSALNITEPGEGYRRGLRTGANLVTINLTPETLREEYLLYRRDRFIMTEERILSALASENLVPSETSLVQHLEANAAENSPKPPTRHTPAERQ